MTANTQQKKPLASDWKVGDRAIIRENDHEYSGVEGKVIEVTRRPLYPLTLEYKDGDGDTQKEYFAPTDLEAVISLPSTQPKEAVDHPDHYGGDTTYEVFKVVEAWGLDEDAYLFNVVKYVARAKKKGKFLEDLKKARVYIDRRIKQLEGAE